MSVTSDLNLEPLESPMEQTEPECECQDAERCPVHFGYDD